MILDRHRVELGQTVWAFVDQEATEVVFRGLAPYSGFYVGERYQEQHVSDDALFASSKEELIAAKVALLRERIVTLERNIAFYEGQTARVDTPGSGHEPDRHAR